MPMKPKPATAPAAGIADASTGTGSNPVHTAKRVTKPKTHASKPAPRIPGTRAFTPQQSALITKVLIQSGMPLDHFLVGVRQIASVL
jgi:hypothetical protein